MKLGYIRFVVLAVWLLTGCETRGVLLLNPDAMASASLQQVYYATTRAPERDGGFGPGLSPTLSYGDSLISIPPTHTIGNIEWPRTRPDPARFFVVAQETAFSGKRAFETSMAAAFRRLPADEHTAIVFVHGFNNNFAEGLVTLAQLSYDFNLPGVAVHYSWPSAASPLGYLHDRDSALFARDGLEELLGAVQRAGAERILLVGHSMGAMLVMETMRQISLQNRRHLNVGKIGLALISPDISVDVFTRQAERLNPMPQPFNIFTSQTDRPLKLSGALASESARLGRVVALEPLSRFPVTLIEVGAFDVGGSGHFIVGSSSALIKVMSLLNRSNQLFLSGAAVRAGLLPGGVTAAGRAARIVLQNVANGE